jgi:sigma-B regulation protein RsbU (phosphoserine phosphatase)
MNSILRIRALWRRLWAQVRWQLIVCYLLIGGISVVLVVAFAAAALNMMILRMASNSVERQIELIVETSGARAEALAARLETSSAASLPPRLPPGTAASIRCQGPAETGVSASYPPGSDFAFPSWIVEDSFRGVVSDGRQISVRALARGRGSRCQIEVMSVTPINSQLAELIARVSELDVTIPTPPPGAPGGPPGLRPPGTSAPGRLPEVARSLWFPLVRSWRSFLGEPVPVVLTTHEWTSGRLIDRVALRLRPDYRVILRQLVQFGQRQAIWIRVLQILGVAFLLVEVAALYLAVRVTHRIVQAVNSLSRGAHEIGAGKLAHRIPVRQDDQLGRLSGSFNEMAASIQTLMRETREKERLVQELRVAREIQESLYPKSIPTFPGIELAAVCRAARNVSGDVYDIFPVGQQGVGLLCADVSGKGVSAALLAASVQSLVRSRSLNGTSPNPAPGDLVSRINRQFIRRIPDNRFITLFWAEYYVASRILRFTNAGHCPPLVFCGGHFLTRLEEGGPPISILPNPGFATYQTELQPGSLLVLYTDGVTEAENAAGEEFGEDRLISLISGNTHRLPADLVDEILAAHAAWTGAVEQSDDITILVLKVL